MIKFTNVSKSFILLQPLDNSDVIPFPGGSDLELTEKQARANCRDLCAFLGTGQVRSDEAGAELVAGALADLRANEAAARAAKARARNEGRIGV